MHIKGTIINRKLNVGLIPEIRDTISSGIMDMRRLIDEDTVLLRGYIYLGTYTFFMSEPLLMREFIVRLLASEKKLNITIPVKRYTG